MTMLTTMTTALAASAEGPSQGYLKYQDQMGHLAVLFWIAVVSIPLMIAGLLFLLVRLLTRKLDTDDSGETETLKSEEGEQP